MSQDILNVARVASAIAALTIPGIVVFDLPDMKPALTDRDCPCLGPSSNSPSYLTDWSQQRKSMDGNVVNSYTLNYTLYHASVGKDRQLFGQYPAMVENARRIANALKELPRVDGCKRISLDGMPAFGQVFDASGQQFHGATFALRVTEF